MISVSVQAQSGSNQSDSSFPITLVSSITGRHVLRDDGEFTNREFKANQKLQT